MTSETIIYARIRHTSPRHPEWVEVFGSDRIPVRAHRHRALFPGKGECDFFFLFLDGISRAARRRLVAHLAERFAETPEEVEKLLEDPKHGVPVLAEDLELLAPIQPPVLVTVLVEFI